MNKTIQIIKNISNNISHLEKIKKEKEYLAAGLSLLLSVGAAPAWCDEMHKFQLGVYSEIEEELIDLLLKGLHNSKKQWLKSLQAEVDEASNFLNENKTCEANP